MQWPLAPFIAGTSVGSDLVFLDLQTDQYTCLPNPAGLTLKNRVLTAASLEAVQPLVDVGYVGTNAAVLDYGERAPPARPATDLPAIEPSHLSFRDFRDFVLSWAETLTRRPGRSLLALHLQVRSDEPDPPDQAVEAAAARVAHFERLLPWAPFPGACMFRSYFLLRFLQRGGLDARWVIGVRTWPFEAHCWLQIGMTVLDDRCERLVRFEPLLAI